MGKSKQAKGAKAGLLETNGSLTPKFKAVLRETFVRFDTDGDGAFSLAELEAFATASKSGNDMSASELKQLGTFFDTNARGYLTLKGFEQMYMMQASQQASDVWRDIANLGYQPSLELLGTTAADAPAATTPETPEVELRAALTALMSQAASPVAHRRVGRALQAMGRDDAAVRSFNQADELELQAEQPSTVEELD